MNEVDRAALEAWDVGPVLSVHPAPHGTINRTLLLTTPAGDYALRAYAVTDRDKLAQRQALLRAVAGTGLPVPPPLPTPAGETLVAVEGRFYALFAQAHGCQITRDRIDEPHTALMGRFLAQVHLALRTVPIGFGSPKLQEVDTAASLAWVDRLIEAIERRPVRDETDAHALRRLEQRRQYLRAWDGRGLPGLADVPMQIIHGDYQESNLLFEEGRVSALLDWDNAGVAPRAWDVVRAMHFMLEMDPAPCRTFWRVYSDVWPLDKEEATRVAHRYGAQHDHSLWLYRAYYVEGNARVRQFIQPGDFVSFADQWDALAPFL